MDRALQRFVSLAALRRAHGRNLGRRGSAAAGSLLVAAADRAARASEPLGAGRLDRAPVDLTQYPNRIIADLRIALTAQETA